MTPLETIRQKCIEANLEIVEWRCQGCNFNCGEYVNGCPKCWRDELSREQNLKLFPKRSVRTVERPFRLADVLLALKRNDIGLQISSSENGWAWFLTDIRSFNPNEVMMMKAQATGRYWNLREDDLSKQSQETIQFLYELLK